MPLKTIWIDKGCVRILDYMGWFETLEIAEDLGCPELKNWEDKLDALTDAGTDHGAVDAFEETAIQFIQSKGYKIIEDGKEIFND